MIEFDGITNIYEVERQIICKLLHGTRVNLILTLINHRFAIGRDPGTENSIGKGMD